MKNHFNDTRLRITSRVLLVCAGIFLTASVSEAGLPHFAHARHGGGSGSAGGSHNNSGNYSHAPAPSSHAAAPSSSQRQPFTENQHSPQQSVPGTMTRGGTTYTQHLTTAGGQTTLSRTSVRAVNGGAVVVTRNYGTTYWGGHPYWAYHYYWGYHPWFWGYYWAPFWTPWPFAWWWIGSPWYGSWGWYYHPYAVYTEPDYWVTDYVISDMLADSYQRGYQNGLAAAGQNSVPGQGNPTISGSVKEQLRDEVDVAAKTFQNDKSLSLQEAFQNPKFIFAVDANLTVMPVAGATACALTEGDLLKTGQAPDSKSSFAAMTVVTSKGGSCPAGTSAMVSFNDLQEMLNAFSQRVDDGLHEFEKHKADVKSKSAPQEQAAAPNGDPSQVEKPTTLEVAPEQESTSPVVIPQNLSPQTPGQPTTPAAN